jgi:hypothetical protein
MAASSKQRNKLIRMEDMRARISQANLIHDVIETQRELSKPAGTLAPVDVQRLKASADIAMKLLNKVLPDLKQVEQTTEVTMTIPTEIGFRIVK